MKLIQSIKKTFLLDAVELFQERIWYLRALLKGSFSQYSEDKFIMDYFSNKSSGTYIDIGANHPFKISNTYLLYSKGWRGVTVEPIPQLHRKHLRMRPHDLALNIGIGDKNERIVFYELLPRCLSTFDSKQYDNLVNGGYADLRRTYYIDVIPLSDIIRKYSIRNVDLLSIDTEGFDMQVLRSINWDCFRPSMIISEDATPVIGSHEVEDTADEVGIFLNTHGYVLLKQLGCNRIFVPDVQH